MRSHPDAPWLTPVAVDFLSQWLRPDDRGLEWGSGRSSIWFAQRVFQLLSIEGCQPWYSKIKLILENKGITNCEYCLVPAGLNEEGTSDHPYVLAGMKVAPASVDFALVDGAMRDHCTKLAITRLKPGGLLIIDNANLYLPYLSDALASVGENGKPPTTLWSELWEELKSWRRYCTSSWSTDTAFFVRPMG